MIRQCIETYKQTNHYQSQSPQQLNSNTFYQEIYKELDKTILEEEKDGFSSISIISPQYTSTTKEQYGEIFTPFYLIEEMLDVFPVSYFKNPHKKWLDIGSGIGYFSLVLYIKLYLHLSTIIPDEKERHEHIIKNMIYMSEIQERNINVLQLLFGIDANIIQGNYLEYHPNTLGIEFDCIIGNPPYNSNGLKKVPTNYDENKSKKQDGKTIWIDFIRHSLSLLLKTNKTSKQQQQTQHHDLCVIIPSIWMKPDKNKMYETLTQHPYFEIKRIKTFTNTETNRIFSKQAQTPTCYVWLSGKKISPQNTIISTEIELEIYDKTINSFIPYSLNPLNKEPIPLFAQSIIHKLKPYLNKYDSLFPITIKTNLPSTKLKFTNEQTDENKDNFPYSNIYTAHLKRHSTYYSHKQKETFGIPLNQQLSLSTQSQTQTTLLPDLKINYSNKPCGKYHNIPKLIMAHKMYGLPFVDEEGKYGISNRDTYLILSSTSITLNDLYRLKSYLQSNLALIVFEATRYRMKYLEKDAFTFLPNILSIPEFTNNPNEITNEYIDTFFNINTSISKSN
jgi:hypothetical protein